RPCLPFFFLIHTAPTSLYPLSLHDALPIFLQICSRRRIHTLGGGGGVAAFEVYALTRKNRLQRRQAQHHVPLRTRRPHQPDPPGFAFERTQPRADLDAVLLQEPLADLRLLDSRRSLDA